MNILLVIIILQLAYLIYYIRKPKTAEEKEQKELKYKKILPQYMNKKCEIIIKEPLAAIDIMFNEKGVLVDMDEEWLMLEVETKKKRSWKMFRIDNISSIKEIVQ